ncbi:hypothetical protein D187_007234 [Cystobacter fuscus DSM 2262]|uniref:Uncharacterized protein n=1 Tax=Cystobacter fuscus (strain ATCC 25194 / DSM 2262 / NBRC 100088 / M29) TaxID=1242864 RepID=S9NX53_CYSF2|nr:hypothetical protein D187_007234 [Cystobacter fuscus DSM 2262]
MDPLGFPSTMYSKIRMSGKNRSAPLETNLSSKEIHLSIHVFEA